MVSHNNIHQRKGQIFCVFDNILDGSVYAPWGRNIILYTTVFLSTTRDMICIHFILCFNTHFDNCVGHFTSH